MVQNSRAVCWETVLQSCHHTLTAMCIIIDTHLPHFPSSTNTQSPIICCAITATCNKLKCHSLPVGYVGLVVPVLPALQRVDVCVDTGLATGHRTRHGETRGSGAVECVSRRSAGVGGL